LAALADVKDQYIPTFGAVGGVGWSYGITLNVPTIVTLNTQSLVYNSSQRDYMRAARASLQAANLALADVRSQVEEETANAYLSLQGAQLRHNAIVEEHGFATKLATIVQDRESAGIESDLDLKKARRTELQIRLQELSVDDELGALQEQLAHLMGLPSQGLTIVSDSIP
jgi:outer membrane protein TolC